MKRSLILILLLAGILTLSAQIDTKYTFSASSATWTALAGTNVPEAEEDDALSPALDIGFSFPYGTQSFTQLKICSNGWIGLGTAQTSAAYSNALNSTTLNPVLAPLWDDLSMELGTVKTLLSGAAPNRTFAIEYANARWDYSATNQFSFKVVISETGRISFHYGPSTGVPQFANASIGINMSPGGSGWFYSVTPGNPATASTITENTNVNQFPPLGTLYEFQPVISYPNDLAAISLTGNVLPIVGGQSLYQVTVRNAGTNAQSTYAVKLYRGSGIEIASVQGTALQPGLTQVFDLPWTPTATGAQTLYGKVVLSGDANPANDQTAPLNVNVMPQGAGSATVGNGSALLRVPLDFYWKNSLYECLFFPGELNFAGTINAIDWYNSFVDAPTGATRVWLGTTDLTSLAAGWIPASELTLVFDGNVNYPVGTNTVRVALQNPYTYLSGNLVMMVQRPFEDQYWSSADYFQGQSDFEHRARRSASDTMVFDPDSPPNNSDLIGAYPKTTFHYVSGSDASDPATPPALLKLDSASPNPFRGSTSLRYSLKEAGQVRLGIYNLRGQLVRLLESGAKAPGEHNASWDGRDGSGNPAAGGIYLCRLEQGGRSSVLKVVLLR